MSEVATPGDQFTVGLVQMTCGELMSANIAKADSLIARAAAGGAQIICLQELFASRYFCQREDASCFDLAEPVPGPLPTRYAALARRLDVVLVVLWGLAFGGGGGHARVSP